MNSSGLSSLPLRCPLSGSNLELLDNDGNNICEILKNINNNIEKSNKIQSKLLEKLDQKA